MSIIDYNRIHPDVHIYRITYLVGGSVKNGIIEAGTGQRKEAGVMSESPVEARKSLARYLLNNGDITGTIEEFLRIRVVRTKTLDYDHFLMPALGSELVVPKI